MRRDLEALVAQQLARDPGATVEVTLRTSETWTLSGAPAEVDRAVSYVVEHDLMELEGPVEYDDELDESFAYLRAR